MDYKCTNCGNTQHENRATHCAVCGHELPRELSTSLDLLQTVQQKPITQSVSNLPQPFSYSIVNDQGQRYSLNAGCEVIVGSGEECDLRLYGPDVNRQHARFYQQDGMFFIQALMASMIFVNGRPLGHLPRQLNLADQVKIGRSILMIVRENMNSAITRQRTQDEVTATTVSSNNSHRRASDDSDLSGIVRHVDGPFMEDPDSTASSTLAKAAKVGITIWKPGLGMLLGHSKQVQVRNYRVQSDTGEMVAVRMKGNISTGMISIGDDVSFWGTWKGGTLHMRRAYNNTLNANVAISQK